MKRVVHFGLGNFARAHVLDYLQKAGGWEVFGVSLRSAAIRDGLRNQGYTYSLSIHGHPPQTIGVLRDVLVAPENPAAVLDLAKTADVITVTVSEKGYCLRPDGSLDCEHPGILRDLEGSGPETLIGFLATALAFSERPVTVLSCDNMVGNGSKLRRAVTAFCELSHLPSDLSHVFFPNSMVDRITPATTNALREQVDDPMAVATEEFSEWVIEDRFSSKRPDWPGVQFVEDVAPHELRKLRMLNGAHSMLAYAGILRGYKFVHEAIADPELGRLARDLMMQAGTILPQSVRQQVPAYADALMARFGNPYLEHKLEQIAMDGSQKVPYRLVESVRAGDAPAAVFGIRSWINWCILTVRNGNVPDDPKASQITDAVQGEDPVADLLRLIAAGDILSSIRE